MQQTVAEIKQAETFVQHRAMNSDLHAVRNSTGGNIRATPVRILSRKMGLTYTGFRVINHLSKHTTTKSPPNHRILPNMKSATWSETRPQPCVHNKATVAERAGDTTTTATTKPTVSKDDGGNDTRQPACDQIVHGEEVYKEHYLAVLSSSGRRKLCLLARQRQRARVTTKSLVTTKHGGI